MKIFRFLSKILAKSPALSDPYRKELKMKRIIALCYGLIYSLIFVGLSDACLVSPEAEITYLETRLGEQSWQYDYKFANTSDPACCAGVNLYEVDFSFDENVTFESRQLPSGWELIAGTGFANTFSIMIGLPPSGADIAPGISLPGFLFEFNAQVGNLAFTAFFTNPEDPTNPLHFEGTTTPVPVPGAIWLLASGLFGLRIIGRKRLEKRATV
jgi:hypothetical protein